MVRVQQHEFPDDRLYDVENQIWYTPLADAERPGDLKVGFTAWATAQMGQVLVFTPKRLGHAFERNKWFAMVESGKWVGAARAAFDGTTVAHNQTLVDRPRLLTEDPYGEGWMLVVRPAREDWRAGLVTGADVGPAVEKWIAAETYRSRTD